MEINYKKPRLIAEIGCNHKGDLEIAREMVRFAKSFCKVDAVKFQKRCNKELLTEEQYNTPHPTPYNSYGQTYGQHREFLEFTVDQHRELKEFCEQIGIVYSTSVWDLTSAKEMVTLNPEFIKIPSACNTNMEMLLWLCDNYSGEIQISLGMTTPEEEQQIIKLFREKGRMKDLVLFSCTSGYPVPFEHMYLLEIKRIYEAYGTEIKEVGFSGHHNGKSIDVAAYTLGATTLERHFTLDRTWKGTDHAASLEPDGLRRLENSLMYAYQSMQYKPEMMPAIEQEQREKLKYRKG